MQEIPLGQTQPETGPLGWAVKVDGVVSLRTASHRPEAAMINGLVLIFGVDSYRTADWTDQMIRDQWYTQLGRVCAHHEILVVPVICTEVTDAAPN